MNGVFPEWLNANSGRAYPLAENSSRTDTSGLVTVPDSLIVAAQINMLPSYVAGTFFISEIVVSTATILISISFAPPGSTTRVVASISVPVAQHTSGTTYPFVGSGQDSSVLGSVTIGSLDDTLSGVPGKVTFEATSTPFEVGALMVSSPALEAVELYSSGALFGRYTSVLKLRAGENIVLSRVDDDPSTVRISARAGANLTQQSDCENAQPVPEPIRTINGIPGLNGNFDIDGGKCIDVATEPGLLKLTDLCAQSCCGCDELASLMAGLKQIEAQKAQLEMQINTVVAQQSSMLVNLAAQQQ